MPYPLCPPERIGSVREVLTLELATSHIRKSMVKPLCISRRAWGSPFAYPREHVEPLCISGRAWGSHFAYPCPNRSSGRAEEHEGATSHIPVRTGHPGGRKSMVPTAHIRKSMGKPLRISGRAWGAT